MRTVIPAAAGDVRMQLAFPAAFNTAKATAAGGGV